MSQHIRYYFIFQLIFVTIFVLMSSVGAFFHFLLDHEISIVENWLHNNTWEIITLSKLLSLFVVIKWFSIRLYELTTIKELSKTLLNWPKGEAFVISTFCLVSFLALGKPAPSEHNYIYWYHNIASYFGVFLFYALEFILIVYLKEVFGALEGRKLFLTKFSFLVTFTIAYRLTIPDYYQLNFYSIFCFATLLYLVDRNLKSWSNVVCFLVVFVCPMATVFGMDPVWGDDYSLFNFTDKFNNLLMLLVWLISFCYYKFRNQLIYSYKKLKR